jgi:glycine/D-amino acid oxidase-like deaminating enzyme
MTDPDLCSLWLRDRQAPAVAPRRGRLVDVDVVVVGAGLAGLCTALRCADAGASVAVIEAGSVAGRTTGHSTAKITALHGLIYADLARGKDLATAATHAAANQEALLRVREVVERLHIDCGLVDADAYTCAATEEGIAAVEDEALAASEAGLPVEVVRETELAGRVLRAVRLRAQAHFDPVAFCTGVAAHLQASGHERGGVPGRVHRCG